MSALWTVMEAEELQIPVKEEPLTTPIQELSPRKQEQVYLLVTEQRNSVVNRQKVLKLKKYVDNIKEARLHLKSLVRRKGAMRLKSAKRTNSQLLLWPPRYTTNAAEELGIGDGEWGMTRRLDYLYHA